eukprot:SAG22_NODE_1065_length_5752_cov_12.512294_1_plen_174_part_10
MIPARLQLALGCLGSRGAASTDLYYSCAVRRQCLLWMSRINDRYRNTLVPPLARRQRGSRRVDIAILARPSASPLLANAGHCPCSSFKQNTQTRTSCAGACAPCLDRRPGGPGCHGYRIAVHYIFTEQRECIESGRVGSPSPLHTTLSPPRPKTSPKESHGRRGNHPHNPQPPP